MKYTIRQYAEALRYSFQDKTGMKRRAVIKRFLETLRHHQKTHWLKAILHEAEMQERAARGIKKIMIMSASPLPKTVHKKIASLFSGKAHIEEKIAPELFAGISIFIDEELLIDASAQNALRLMFRK